MRHQASWKPASAQAVSFEVSRSGEIPGPTVIVRMGESNGF
ncbi:hypothetical protein D083_3457 [Dickeya solani RNS 08.23.3.1.A]|nr:hypothetical protein D083_3457 [Dickeya solani RNS 08.23.3.1.A]